MSVKTKQEVEVLEVGVRLMSPAFEIRYGSKNYKEIKEKAKDDFYTNLGEIIEDEESHDEYFVPSKQFIEKLDSTVPLILPRDAEFEYFGDCHTYPIPIGFKKEVIEKLREGEFGSALEGRVERLLAQAMSKKEFPVVLKVGSTYSKIL